MINIRQRLLKRVLIILIFCFLILDGILILQYTDIFNFFNFEAEDIRNISLTSFKLNEKDCLKPGEIWSYGNSTPECCSNLRPIVYSGLTSFCSGSLTISYTCSNCGNGTCDKYEHFCNCREDCTEAESLDKEIYQREYSGAPRY